MPVLPHLLPDVDRRGKNTVQWTLDPFDYPALKTRRILSLGYSEAGTGYQIIRKNPGFSNINVTISGRGEVLIHGEWKKITAGMASLSPKGVLHGARSLPGVRWEFCWISFAEPAGTSSHIAVPEPTVTHTDPRPIAWALLSLQRELQHGRQKPILEALLQLLDLYLQRITAPWPVENHLWKLWEKVAQLPAHPWTDEEMARQVHFSSRHLLRLCKKESGRTLHEQLAHIRLTKAASLLQDRSLKLQAVAEAVGYQDAFAFSKAFKRWSGVSPKAYRAGF
jgi:AraC-like DNA-binding protein